MQCSWMAANLSVFLKKCLCLREVHALRGARAAYCDVCPISYAGEVRDCAIAGNAEKGIEVDHGQQWTFSGNVFSSNGGDIFLMTGKRFHSYVALHRHAAGTDGSEPFPPAVYPALNLPNQTVSGPYTISGNTFGSASGGITLQNTTLSVIFNNAFMQAPTAVCDELSARGGTVWNVPEFAGTNIVGGPSQVWCALRGFVCERASAGAINRVDARYRGAITGVIMLARTHEETASGTLNSRTTRAERWSAAVILSPS